MEKYTDLTLRQFVASSADIRWCPYPDCGYAICIRREAAKEESAKVGGATKEEKGFEVKGGVAKEEEEEVGEAVDEEGVAEEGVASAGYVEKKLTRGENVECGQGHGFCW